MNIVTRTDLINFLIKKIGAKSYLEIGLGDGVNFSNVLCDDKISVDPFFRNKQTYFMTSDEFFKINKKKFDLIFIDGLHHEDQVTKDILNSLKFLNENGIIVCHDMNPESEEIQVIPYNGYGAWTGDCWKAFVNLRMSRNDLEMFTVNMDYGCGVIKRGSQKLLEKDELSYTNLNENRKKWLNLVEVDEFLNQHF
jgi:hypothetical protein